MFQLRVTLREVSPPPWRRLLVPGSVKLAKLHDYLQAAMGWTNSHLHCFEIAEDRYGMQFDEYPEGELDEKSVTVLRVIGNQAAFIYEYDFGDSWEHEITVERIARMPRGLQRAVCLDGENSCPPEDCGGSGGYSDLLHVLADRSHPDHRELLNWMGGPFDASQFDVVAANVALQAVR